MAYFLVSWPFFTLLIGICLHGGFVSECGASQQNGTGDSISESPPELSLKMMHQEKTGLVLDSRANPFKKRYTFVQTQKASFREAVASCRRLDSILLIIDSPKEHEYLIEVLKLIEKPAENEPWEESYWVFAAKFFGCSWEWSCTGNDVWFTLWGNGEPDPNFDCVHMYSKDGFRLATNKCERSANYICTTT